MSYTLVLEWMPGDLYMSAVTARCTAPTSSYSVVWLPPNKVYQITLYCGSTSLVSFLVGAFRGKAWSYMRKMNLKTNITKRISMCIALLLCLLIAGCSNSDAGERGVTDFEHVEAEYLETIANLNWPEGVTLPESLEGEDTGASFQVGYGDTRASNLWEYCWMKEWLDSYNIDPERAQKALEELETAFDMPYMGEDRCDDATRNYLRENIDKAKLGDPSGFMECIEVNYAN